MNKTLIDNQKYFYEDRCIDSRARVVNARTCVFCIFPLFHFLGFAEMVRSRQSQGNVKTILNSYLSFVSPPQSDDVIYVQLLMGGSEVEGLAQDELSNNKNRNRNNTNIGQS